MNFATGLRQLSVPFLQPKFEAKVLIAEDHPLVAELAQDALKAELGLKSDEFTHVTTGHAAIQALKTDPEIKFVYTDQRMLDSDEAGNAVIHHIQSNNLPVEYALITSGINRADFVPQDRFFDKPAAINRKDPNYQNYINLARKALNLEA